MLTVSTDTQVDLLLEGVGLVGLGDSQDSILQSQWVSNGITTAIGMCWRSYGRTLRHVGPGGGVSGADNNGAHTSVTGSSLTAGDSEGGQHGEWRRIG